MSFNDYDDLDKYAAAGVTSTTFPQLTLYNHPDWRFAVLKFMHTFGPAGLAIFNGMKRTTKKPAMLASWTYRVYDQDTGEDKEFTVRWSDDPDRHLREYNAKLDKWQAREDKVKALEKRLWAALLSCLEPELERRTTLREELWGPIAATADTYELWQLLERVCGEHARESAQATLQKFTALKWDPTKHSLTDFLTKFDAVHRNLIHAGKPQSSDDLVSQLQTSFREVDHPMIRLLLSPALLYKPGHSEFPEYETLRDQLLNLEIRDATLDMRNRNNQRNNSGGRGAGRRNQGGANNQPVWKAGDSNDERRASDLAKSNAKLAKRISNMDAEEAKLMFINQLTKQPAGGNGRGGGGRDAGGRGNGGRTAAGRGAGRTGDTERYKYPCWGCDRLGHNIRDCTRRAVCKTCGESHHTKHHDAASRSAPGKSGTVNAVTKETGKRSADTKDKKATKKLKASTSQVTAEKTRAVLSRFTDTDSDTGYSTNMIRGTVYRVLSNPGEFSAVNPSDRGSESDSHHSDSDTSDTDQSSESDEQEEEESEGDSADESGDSDATPEPLVPAPGPLDVLSPPPRKLRESVSHDLPIHAIEGEHWGNPDNPGADLLRANTARSKAVTRALEREMCDLQQTRRRAGPTGSIFPDEPTALPAHLRDLPKPDQLLQFGRLQRHDSADPLANELERGRREYALSANKHHAAAVMSKLNDNVAEDDMDNRTMDERYQRALGIVPSADTLRNTKRNLVLSVKMRAFDAHPDTARENILVLRNWMREYLRCSTAGVTHGIPDPNTLPAQHSQTLLTFLRAFWRDGMGADAPRIPGEGAILREYYLNCPIFVSNAWREGREHFLPQRVPVKPDNTPLLEGPWRVNCFPTSQQWGSYLMHGARARARAEATEESEQNEQSTSSNADRATELQLIGPKPTSKPRSDPLHGVYIKRMQRHDRKKQEKHSHRRSKRVKTARRMSKCNDHHDDDEHQPLKRHKDHDDRDDHRDAPESVFMIITCSAVDKAKPTTSNEHKYVLGDSGASYNMELTTEHFANDFVPNNGTVQLKAANDSALDVTHCADVPNLGLTVCSSDISMRIWSIGQGLTQGNTIRMGLEEHAHLPPIDGNPVVMTITHPDRKKPIYGFLSKSYHILLRCKDYARIVKMDESRARASVQSIEVKDTSASKDRVTEEDSAQLFTPMQKERAHQGRR